MAVVLHVLDTEGLALISAGTHPAAFSREQPITPYAHYAKLEAEFQDITRNHPISGLHIHIGVEGRERDVALMNQLRSWLPYLLALSTNSPFWAGGHLTGITSYCSVAWNTT